MVLATQNPWSITERIAPDRSWIASDEDRIGYPEPDARKEF